MIKRYNFNLEAWMIVDIDGDSVEDCDKQFNEATLGELVENGFVKEFEISDLDESIIEERAKVRVYDIDWDTQFIEDDATISQLPQSVEIVVNIFDKDDIDEFALKEAISDELYSLFDVYVDDYKYEVLELS